MFNKSLLFFLLLCSILVLVPVRFQSNLQEKEEILNNKVYDINNILSFPPKVVKEKMTPLADVKEVTTYIEGDPINILNDSAFGLDGYNFPGSGTSSNPYVIQGYDITADTSALIHIANTSVHFEINNCYLNGLESIYDLILLDNATNGIIINNTITNTSGTGIHLISNSTDNLCKDNLIQFCAYDGIYVEDSNDNIFVNNTVFECEYAFEVYFSNNTLISGNNISGYYPSNMFNVGIYLSDVNNNSISSNTIINAGDYTIGIYGGSENNVTRNLVMNSSNYGIDVYGSNNLIYYNFFLNNNIAGNSQGSDTGDSNSWDNETHGNYWSDYTGPDEVAPYGIGETNYTLDGDPMSNDTAPLVPVLNLIGPGDLYYEAEAITNTITWNLNANLIGEYTIYRDNDMFEAGKWTTQTNFQVNLLALVLNNVYNYTLVVSDIVGNTMTDTVMVTARDTIAPVITYTGSSEISFEVNTTGHTITVSATDMYPDTYVLYQNGTGITPKTWESDTPIITSLDELSVGSYNFTLVVKDTSGNTATQTVFVTVTASPSEATTITPTITTTITTTTSTITTTTTTEKGPGFEIIACVLILIFTVLIVKHQKR